jgi:hypothetical protein
MTWRALSMRPWRAVTVTAKAAAAATGGGGGGVRRGEATQGYGGGLAEGRVGVVGPGGCCSPRHRVPFNSRDEASQCVG